MQKTLIYINAETKAQIDASGYPIKKSAEMLHIERGQWQVLCFQFIDVTTDDVGGVTLTPHTLTSASFVLVADNDFRDNNALMLKSYSSTVQFNESDPESNRMNIEGDWIDGGTADLSSGQLSVRVNSDTVKFAECVGNVLSVSNSTYISIKQYDTAEVSNPSSIVWTKFVAVNTIRDWENATENPPEGSSLVPFVDSYLKQPFEYQFSTDSVSWHTTQTTDDRYYRQRIKGVQSEWSPAIAITISTGGSGGSDKAADISIADSGNNFTATNVEGALAELAGKVGNVESLLAEI